jgi:hypothetical protein
MNTTRRDALRKIGLAGSLITIPAVAGVMATNRAEAATCSLPAGEPDRALFEAIRDWRVINIAYLGIDGWEDEDCDALSNQQSAAVLRVFDIAPTTLAGLRALCEFGAELMSSQRTVGSDLGAYTPGGSIGVSAPSAEELLITALNRAAATLLPAASEAGGH